MLDDVNLNEYACINLLSQQQLSELADLYADEHDKGMKRIAPNFRDTQQLSGRRVYSSLNNTITHDDSLPFNGTQPIDKTDPKQIQIHLQTIDARKLSHVLNQLGKQASIYGKYNGRGRNRNNRRRRS